MCSWRTSTGLTSHKRNLVKLFTPRLAAQFKAQQAVMRGRFSSESIPAPSWVDTPWEMWHYRGRVTEQKELCWNFEQGRGLWTPYGYKRGTRADHAINSEQIAVYSKQPCYTPETRGRAGFHPLLPTSSKRTTLPGHVPPLGMQPILTVPIPSDSLDVRELLKVTTAPYICFCFGLTDLLSQLFRCSYNPNKGASLQCRDYISF